MQKDYYNFLKESKFVIGDARNPEKDAREKTSGLVDIGLIDKDRKITSVGRALLGISRSGVFNSDNALQIPAVSFVFLKQLLKTTCNVSGNSFRPLLIFAYFLLQLGHLTNDEFTYLLPLCTTVDNTSSMVEAIRSLRNGEGSIDEIILSRLLSMDKYREALDYFLNNTVNEKIITKIGMNRKSSGTGEMVYDKPYYHFYKILFKVAIDHDVNEISSLYNSTGKLSVVVKQLWRKYLFKSLKPNDIKRKSWAVLNDVPILRAGSDENFKRLFFSQLHLFKAKATLYDYADLNRRYFKTTDTVIFNDSKVEFDVLPRCWLYSVKDRLMDIAFTVSDNLTDNTSIYEIAPFLDIVVNNLYANLNEIYGINATILEEVNRAIIDRAAGVERPAARPLPPAGRRRGRDDIRPATRKGTSNYGDTGNSRQGRKAGRPACRAGERGRGLFRRG